LEQVFFFFQLVITMIFFEYIDIILCIILFFPFEEEIFS
jgi:hypothetical protein